MSGQDNDFREIIDDENTDTSSDVVEVTEILLWIQRWLMQIRMDRMTMRISVTFAADRNLLQER